MLYLPVYFYSFCFDYKTYYNATNFTWIFSSNQNVHSLVGRAQTHARACTHTHTSPLLWLPLHLFVVFVLSFISTYLTWKSLKELGTSDNAQQTELSRVQSNYSTGSSHSLVEETQRCSIICLHSSLETYLAIKITVMSGSLYYTDN